MKKLKLKEQYKHLYKPRHNKVTAVDVPAFNFVLVDGAIEPGKVPGNSPSFRAAIQAVYEISYTLKYLSKEREENPIDYVVMPLEALWWVENGVFDITKPSHWRWTAMMMQPDHITGEMFQAGIVQVLKKKPNPAVDLLRFEIFQEGLAMQIMHIGPYAEEPVTLKKMEVFARENSYTTRGKYHEIYLGNPSRTKPEDLKTVLRQPVEKEVASQ